VIGAFVIIEQRYNPHTIIDSIGFLEEDLVPDCTAVVNVFDGIVRRRKHRETTSDGDGNAEFGSSGARTVLIRYLVLLLKSPEKGAYYMCSARIQG